MLRERKLSVSLCRFRAPLAGGSSADELETVVKNYLLGKFANELSTVFETVRQVQRRWFS
jgi:hypothetical protein